MFTGIVEELGEVVRLTDSGGDSAVLAVRGPLVTSDARHGDSISVNGVCLTVIDNVGFGLKLRGRSGSERRSRATADTRARSTATASATRSRRISRTTAFRSSR